MYLLKRKENANHNTTPVISRRATVCLPTMFAMHQPFLLSSYQGQLIFPTATLPQEPHNIAKKKKTM
jgi:hypothetical protein